MSTSTEGSNDEGHHGKRAKSARAKATTSVEADAIKATREETIIEATTRALSN
jgi:hypothetical protein